MKAAKLKKHESLVAFRRKQIVVKKKDNKV
jgi:hypothetical protein